MPNFSEHTGELILGAHPYLQSFQAGHRFASACAHLNVKNCQKRGRIVRFVLIQTFAD
jgi:hypothetical protein